MKRTPTLLLAASASLLAVPAAVSAATLTPAAACAPSTETAGGGTSVPLAGAGFTPNQTITISGAAAPITATSDATGSFTAELPAQSRDSFTPQTITLTAADPANPANSATAAVSVARFGSNAPLTGKPTSKTTWRFAGFQDGKGIYGHFRLKGKTIKNYRFGAGKGPCGTLTVRARRLPTTSRTGTWTLQVDNAKSYSANTRPAFKTSFTISRRFG